MSFRSMKAANGGEYRNPTPGAVSAVCTRLIDLGTQDSQFGAKRKIMVSWEIDEDMDDGRPFLVNSMYTHSMHEKAALRQMLEGWRGKAFQDAEAFDLTTILGKPCMLTLTENDKGYVNVTAVAGLPKGMKAMEPAAELVMFDLDEPDWDAWEALSDRLKERIEKAPEFRRAEERSAGPNLGEDPPAVAEEGGEFDDRIPFRAYMAGTVA